jgi:hypothetical protein
MLKEYFEQVWTTIKNCILIFVIVFVFAGSIAAVESLIFGLKLSPEDLTLRIAGPFACMYFLLRFLVSYGGTEEPPCGDLRAVLLKFVAIYTKKYYRIFAFGCTLLAIATVILVTIPIYRFWGVYYGVVRLGILFGLQGIGFGASIWGLLVAKPQITPSSNTYAVLQLAREFREDLRKAWYSEVIFKSNSPIR